jgi:hypothetical protein
VKFQPIVFFVGFFWILSILYCLRWHYKEGNIKIPTIILSVFFGPILFLILIDNNIEMKKIERENKRAENERESNNRHRRWFRTMSEINRQTIPSFGRTIPPPPPMSRIVQARIERDEAIRSAIERIEPPNRRPINKDFKFFH